MPPTTNCYLMASSMGVGNALVSNVHRHNWGEIVLSVPTLGSLFKSLEVMISK